MALGTSSVVCIDCLLLERQGLLDTENSPSSDHLHGIAFGHAGSVPLSAREDSVMKTDDRRQLPGASNQEIPDSVKRKANMCNFDFSCSTTGRCSLQETCKVEESLSEDIVSVTARPLFDCPYYVLFGNGHICTCPVRAYLHTNNHR